MTCAVAPLALSASDPNWTLLRNIGLALVVVLWLATAYWTFKDARRRIAEPWLVGLATLVGLFPPFLGPIIYMFFRPPEYLEDARERELEIKAMEERLAQLDSRCPVCRARVELSYLVCPVCTTRLRHACPSCGQPVESLWQICPYCATEIAQGLPALGEIERRPRGSSRAGRSAGRQRLDSAAAWPARPHSSSSSPTACAAGSPVRSSRASSAAVSSCVARAC